MKRFCIVCKRQFGYWTDYYYFSKYLSNTSRIIYICFDEGLEKVFEDNVSVIYIDKLKKKSSLINDLYFIWISSKLIINNKIKLTLVNYFRFCFLYRILLYKFKLVLDIRSAGIIKDEKKRIKNHKLIKISTYFFNHTTILAETLRSELKLNAKNTSIVPLGGDPSTFSVKEFNKINLLYVGVITNRNIHDTVSGLKILIDRFPGLKETIHYDIIGYGTHEFESLLTDAIKESSLSSIIQFHGRKTIKECIPFWKKSNIGIVYVPQIPAYQNQPPTKLFESLFSGMPVIATNTIENSKYVNTSNGVVIEDNPESFAYGLEKIIHNLQNFSSSEIINTVKEYSWENNSEKLEKILTKYYD